MSHNSWTATQVESDRWECHSHNFPDVVGVGENEQQAFNAMSNQLDDLFATNPARMRASIRERLRKGLQCACGHKLDGPEIGFVGRKGSFHFPKGRKP